MTLASSLVRTALIALPLLTLACGSSVSEGGGSSGGECNSDCGCDDNGDEITDCGTGGGGQNPSSSGGSSPSSTTGGNPTGGGIVSNGIALFESEMPDDPLPGSGSSTAVSGSSGGGPAPDTLYVMFSNLPLACLDPNAAPTPCGHKEVTVSLPPSAQVAGLVSLASGVYITFSESGPADEEGECWFGGGGSGSEGYLDIVSIDDEQVTIDFTGSPAEDFGFSGPQTALRCF